MNERRSKRKRSVLGHSPEPAQRFPIVRRYYRPGVDLDDRLKRVFALLSLAPEEKLDDARKRELAA